MATWRAFAETHVWPARLAGRCIPILSGVIPCHRVVFSNGSVCTGFAFGGKEVQKAMLEDEGVEVSEDYKIDLKKYRWEI